MNSALRLAKARILVTRFPYESQWGGEEVHTFELMCGLDKRGHEVFFMGSCSVLLKAFEKGNFPVKKVNLSKPPVSKKTLILFTLLSPILFIKSGFHLWQAKKQWQVDTVYMLSFGEKLLMTPWAKLFGLKVLWLEHARIGEWMTSNPWRKWYRFCSQWVTVVVTSKAMLKYVRGLAHYVKAIPCSVMASKASPLPNEINSFLKSGFSIANVSRLTVDKGVDMMVRLVHSKPEIRMIFVGDGAMRNELSKAAKSKQVMWVKSLSRPELMTLYKSVDLFVLASKETDPFGMVAAEAMWHGAPTLLTDKCGISEDLHNGREAYIVAPSFSALDKAVKKLMKHENIRKDLGQAGQKFARKNYDFKTMLNLFEALINSSK